VDDEDDPDWLLCGAVQAGLINIFSDWLFEYNYLLVEERNAAA